MSSIAGKTIVITGAASGLGRAWSMGFLNDGARVVAADVNRDGLEELRLQGAIPSATDVANERQVKAMIDLALQETGRVDVMFNNAGIGLPRRVEDLPEGEFEKIVAIHLFGTIYGMRAAIPIMRQQSFGRIINTISRGAEVNEANFSAYGASKAAIWAVTRSASKEVADTDILLNMLIPGPTNTAIWGRDMPQMQSAEVTYPTALMLATLPANGPTGKVFWNEKEYPLFDPNNTLEQVDSQTV
jgi:NAD(P)-dependent dehydrogenase (short-subunit alcohol dehydrogenase family)